MSDLDINGQPLAPGVSKANALKAAGFTDTEIEQWKSETAGQLNAAGFNTNEVDEYFGHKNPSMEPIKQVFKQNEEKHDAANSSTDGTPKAAKTFEEAIEAGWQISVSGLLGRGAKPNVVLPEDAPMFYRIASQVSGLAGDIPAMITGSVAGAEVGGLTGAGVGSVLPGAGTVTGATVGAAVGGGYGAFALPAAIRKVMMDHYEKGDVQDFQDFWERSAATFIEANKQGLVGAATAGVGGVVGKALSPIAAPAIKTTAQLTSEVGTMVTLGKAVEGEVPQPSDFIDAAILVGGMHGAGHIAGKLRSTYGSTGVKPSDVALQVQSDPIMLGELASQDNLIPSKLASESGVKTTDAIKIETPKEVKPQTVERSEATNKVLESVGEPTGKTSDPYTTRKAYKDFVDKFDPINEAVKLLEKDPSKLSVDENPYNLARMANDYKSKVKYVFEKGNLDYETLAKTGKSFDEIITPFKKDPQSFEAYLISKRAIEVEGYGKTSGIDSEAAKKVVAEGKAKYEQAAQDLYEFKNNNLKYLKDSGVISSEEFKNITELNKNHVSFARILEDSKGGTEAGGKNLGSLKEFKGSELKIQSPLKSTLENTEAMFKVAEKNRAAVKLVELAEKEKGQTILSRVEKPKNKLKADEFEVYRNGEREVWASENKDIAQAIKALDGDVTSTNILMKLAKNISGIKRLSIALAPDFVIKNFFRDQLTAGTFSKGGSYPFIDAVVAMKDIVGKNDNYYNWLKSGGAGGSFLELNESYLKNNFYELDAQTKLTEKVWNVVKKPVEFMQAAGALTEQATRLAEFKRVSKGASSGKEVFAGGFASREVTVDFTRIGAKMSALNSITAFQNVSIQGLDRTIRAIKENPGGVAARAVTAITVPSVLLWWANKDDERYKQIPRWQKDAFWIIPTDSWQKASQEEADGLPDHLVRGSGQNLEINKGVIYRIPKPQELGILFGSLPERVLEKYFTDNPNAMKDFEKTLGNLIEPSIVPDAISPFIEQKFNRGLFTDAKVVPAYLENIAPEYQYTEYTSESAKQLAKMIKFLPGVGSSGSNDLSISSPVVIDNYARAWSGNLGVYALRIADKALVATGASPDPLKPADTLADIPVVKAFVVRYPGAGSQSIQDFYDNYAKQKQKFDTVQFLAKSQDFENLQKELDKFTSGEDPFVKLDTMKQALTTQGQMIRLINKNTDYTPDEKRQLIDGIYYGMIEITKQGNEILDVLKKASKEMEK